MHIHIHMQACMHADIHTRLWASLHAQEYMLHIVNEVSVLYIRKYININIQFVYNVYIHILSFELHMHTRPHCLCVFIYVYKCLVILCKCKAQAINGRCISLYVPYISDQRSPQKRSMIAVQVQVATDDAGFM